MRERGMRLASASAAETAAFGRSLGRCARAGDVLLIEGPVGVGKTVLAGGVLEGLGVPGPYPSPTFTLVRTYRGRLPAVHADLYRLEEGLIAEEIGWDDLLGEGGVTIVEWAERLAALAPDDALRVRIARAGHVRSIECGAGGPAAARWLAEVSR